MSFNFPARADSSDEDAAVDLSAWQSGAKRKRVTPPRRSSGFQAVNQPSEDVEMEMEPEAPAPVAQMLPAAEEADPMLISSDRQSDDDDGDEEEEVAPVIAPVQDESAGAEDDEEEDDAIEVQPQIEEEELEEEELVVPKPNKIRVLVPRDELEDEDPADFEDFTAGGDVVASVLQEQQDEDGVMIYLVEFEDHHVAEVSLEHVIAHCMCGRLIYISFLLSDLSTRLSTHRHVNTSSAIADKHNTATLRSPTRIHERPGSSRRI